VTVASFESAEALQNLKLTGATVGLSGEHTTEGHKSLRIDFERGERSSVEFASGERPWDWSAYGGIALDLTNPSDQELSFGLRIDQPPGTSGAEHFVSGRSTLRPRQTASYIYFLGDSTPMQHGMRGGPPFAGLLPFTFASYHRVKEGHIAGFRLSVEGLPAPRTLYVDNIRLMPPVSYEGIVDAFGQYARADWPGKIKSESDLIQSRADEEAATKAAPTLPDRDEFGGWASGPQLPATGFFTTTKRDGKWWLVTPTGHLFLSLGIDVIELENGYTMVEGREKMFTWLPAPGEPLARHFSSTSQVLYGPLKKGRTFNFYNANLERKYGPDWPERWRSFALDRLRAWGFNTIANWSDPELYDLKKVPYTVTVDLAGDYARVSSGEDYWGKMHDPFDPKFATAVDKSLREPASKYRDDPWCLGYFIDNEISWGSGNTDRSHYGLAYGALAEGESSPAKNAFVSQLKLHYGKIRGLNRAWNTNFGSWEALRDKPFQPGGELTPQMRHDFGKFLKAFAEQYFEVIKTALRRYDPNHLYLGCRFAWRTPEAVAASALYVDVVSFNIYRSRVDAKEWDFTKTLHKPVIIGEFHFGALDRGMFHTGLVAVPSQKARAEMYQDYIRSVVDHPASVGCAWFQYYDEPLTGRTYDGENYNIGFLTATDTPYPEMVAAAKAVHAEVYQRRAAQ
jgi:hypothetical protein